jgi:hypothetical protein
MGYRYVFVDLIYKARLNDAILNLFIETNFIDLTSKRVKQF